MNDYNINVRLNEVITIVNAVKDDIESLKKVVKSEDDMWDGSDIIRNWKISERTLAEWRKMKMIGYVQVQKKIYYPQAAREAFMKNNFVPANEDQGGASYEN